MNNNNKKSISTLSEDEKGRLRRLLNFSGLIFLLGAAYTVFSPETIEGFFGFDETMRSIFAIALIIAALGDFIIARLLFGKKDKA